MHISLHRVGSCSAFVLCSPLLQISIFCLRLPAAMSIHPVAPFSPLTPLSCNAVGIEYSDGMSSEGYSSENSDGFVQPRKQHNPEKAPVKNSAANRASQSNVASKGKPGRPLARKSEKARPLCLDFLNGNCGRLRAHCRYYHPEPGELLTQEQQKKAGVCEVWALTGFCKFGDKCWKKHPAPGPTAPTTCIAEPLTRKFQGWMQSQQAARQHAAESLSPTSPSFHPASESTPAPMPLPFEHHLRTAIMLLQHLTTNPEHSLAMLCKAAVDGTGLSFHELLPLVHAKALSELRSGWVFVQLALRLRPALAVEEQAAFDRQFYDILKTSILSTLEDGPSLQMVRGRGVRNVKVCRRVFLPMDLKCGLGAAHMGISGRRDEGVSSAIGQSVLRVAPSACFNLLRWARHSCPNA